MGSAGGGGDLCVGLYGGRMGLGRCVVTAGLGQVVATGVGCGSGFAWYGVGGARECGVCNCGCL